MRDGMDVINLSLGEAEIEPSRDIVAARARRCRCRRCRARCRCRQQLRGARRRARSTSPGSSDRAITVAAESEQGGAQIASFSSGGPDPALAADEARRDRARSRRAVVGAAPRRALGELQRYEHGRPPRRRGRRAPAPAAPVLVRRSRSSRRSSRRASRCSGGGQEAETTREGGGTVDLVRADTPLLFASPTGLSFGHVAPGGSALARVTLTDAGGGAGPWAAATSIQQAAAGSPSPCRRVTVPGRARRDRDRGAGRDAGHSHGLRRAHARSRSPADPVLAPRLGARARGGPDDAADANRHVQRQHAGAAGARRDVPLPRGSRAASASRGRSPARSRSSASTCSKRVANFGVAVTGGRRDVQPRVVRAGDENRLLGEIALPYNANPYLPGFGAPDAGRRRCASRRRATTTSSSTRASASRAGPFTFRFWIGDTTPPRLRFLSARGGVVRVRARDGGAGVDPELHPPRRRRPAHAGALRLPAAQPIVPRARKLKRGRHALRLVVSDYQELEEHGERAPDPAEHAPGCRKTFVVR